MVPIEGVERRRVFMLGSGFAVLGVLGPPLACSSSDDTPARVSQEAGPTPGSDSAPPHQRREAGAPQKCAIYSGSTSSTACSCGDVDAPFGGAATDKCPIDDLPHACAEYDVLDPAPIHRECTCQPKCLFQKVAASGDAGAIDTCRCGFASHLVLGGQGSKDETRATCTGFAVCCRFNTGCDCTSDPSYACPGTAQKVPSCTPDDFREDVWRSVVYGPPAFIDPIAVPRCR